MNKTHLLLTALLIAGTIFAQDDKLTITKGTLVLGGSGQISSEKTTSDSDFFSSEEMKSTRTIFSLDLGVAIADNFVLGGNLGYGHTKTPDIEFNLTGIGMFVERYLGVGEKTAFHLRVDGAYAFGESPDNPFFSTSKSDLNSFAFSLSPGFSFFISNKIALRATIAALTYTTLKRENSSDETTVNSFDFNYDLSNVTVGINFYL